jgi:hypothetical protein
VPVYRVAPHDPSPDGAVYLEKDAGKQKGAPKNADVVREHRWCVVAVTPGGTYGMIKARWGKDLFDHRLCDCLVLDEASQMNLPEAAMVALPLKRGGQLVVQRLVSQAVEVFQLFVRFPITGVVTVLALVR